MFPYDKAIWTHADGWQRKSVAAEQQTSVEVHECAVSAVATQLQSVRNPANCATNNNGEYVAVFTYQCPLSLLLRAWNTSFTILKLGQHHPNKREQTP